MSYANDRFWYAFWARFFFLWLALLATLAVGRLTGVL